jgi:hypothetical protein
VDRVASPRILVADLDHHLSADRVRKYFAVIWSHEVTLVLSINIRDPFYGGLALYTQRRTRPL